MSSIERLPIRFDDHRTGIVGLHGGHVVSRVVASLGARSGGANLPLSFFIHFAGPVLPTETEVEINGEHRGGNMRAVAFGLIQAERTVAFGVCSFGRERGDGIAYCDLPLPDVPPPEMCRRMAREESALTRWADHFDMRPCIGGAPFSGQPIALTGGWIRPTDGRKVDAAFVAGVTDSWFPSIRTRLTRPTMMQPTIDLAINFVARSPAAYRSASDYMLIEVRSPSAESGLWQEDAVIWSRSGSLLVRSRQLAIIQ